MAVKPKFSIKKQAPLNVEQLFSELTQGSRPALSKALTLVESTKPSHREQALKLVELATPQAGNAFRIGITGVPGVGKSTFIEAFGLHLLKQNKKICVLAIDPSSEISKGSLLGDKTRMELLSREDNAYIRPSPTAGNLGGVARATREAIILCEAAGYDYILVETVGVGQSETKVHGLVDVFIMLLLANAGDEIQGIKRGIMEMADILVVNKADGENQKAAKIAVQQLQQALHYFPLAKSGWNPSVDSMSALEKENIDKVWSRVKNYKQHVNNNGYFEANRKQQSVFWFKESLTNQLVSQLLEKDVFKTELNHLEEEVQKGNVDPFIAADKLLSTILHNFS